MYLHIWFSHIDPYEEKEVFSKIIEDLKERSGGGGKIMSYIFKEYFDLPVSWKGEMRSFCGVTE